MKRFWETLCGEWRLGAPTGMPQPVSGGYMHKMFRLDTPCGSYAVKLLNPEVMRRPDAPANYRNAERLEAVLEENGLPIVAALCRDGQKMHRIGEQHYYLFPWVAHRALPETAVTPEHCAVIGGLLARMHSLPCETLPMAASQPEPMAADWEGLAHAVEHAWGRESALSQALVQELPLLEHAGTLYNRGVEALPPLVSICNGDMDVKNVLWQGSDPVIIDLECLELGNPVNDLVQLALGWAGDATGGMDETRLDAFLAAYRHAHPLPPVDWAAVCGLGFFWLDWLHYNLRRACGLASDTPEERMLGCRQAQETLVRIRSYAEKLPAAVAQFCRIMNG